jgi:hypothetical protein
MLSRELVVTTIFPLPLRPIGVADFGWTSSPRTEPDLAKQNISKCCRQLFEMIERITSYAVALLPYLGLI